MLESKNTQFTLSAEGQILWQKKLNNPLEGQPIAVLSKGVHPLKPVIALLDNEITAQYLSDDEKKQALVNTLKIWLNWHMSEVVGALVNLEIPEGAEVKNDAVSKIAAKVYDGMGIVPREDVENIIEDLTPEMRAELRAKKIRLGPILVFIPELNKPAAVRLRGLLWSLYNGRILPARIPADGIVSVEIEDSSADPIFYRSIGYPLYGGRAVRIDMLDRVISCVYDHAEDGKFRARHEMAEWLGSSIEGLYKVLEAMGHKKIYDPADEVEKQDTETQEVIKEELVKEESVKDKERSAGKEDKESEPEQKSDDKPSDKPNEKSGGSDPIKKPELAVFRLKKGKAFQSKRRGGGDWKGKKSFSDKKKSDNSSGRRRSKGKYKKKSDNRDRAPRVITAEAKTNEADNPFAILQQLKK